jgi:microcystin-dependent protein
MSKILGVHSGGRIGEIMDHGSSTLPGYALACNGTAVSRTTYASLFAAIGTQFGVGDGSTTFNLPNGQALFKRGAGSQTVGGVAMAATHGVTQGDQMQGHYHNVSTNGTNGNAGTAAVYSSLEGVTGTIGSAANTEVSDGSNGTPRTGTETRPASLPITYGIIYK